MQKLTLTRATEEDCRFLYDLRNEEDVRKNSFQTETFSYESHMAWYKEKLGDKQTQIYVLKLDGENIGQARVDLHGVDGEISYALCQKARGYGYAKWMLRCMEERLREQAFCRKMTAEVKRENIASQKIFEGLSYSSVSTDYGYIYEKEIPLFNIIMCTYNSAQTVDTAISSVKNQKFDGWEMLILDNGSSDATVEKLKQYERLDERIKCIYRKDNIGWCKGISECLKMSVGSYMMFLGADDFITKPYNTQILSARISAMLKRTHKEKVNDFLQYQGLKLQLNSSTVIYKDQIIELSKNEMRILYTLLQHKESIVSRNQLMESLWQSNEFIDDNTLTVNVNRVRKKLEAAGLKDFIKTKRGQGYMI